VQAESSTVLYPYLLVPNANAVPEVELELVFPKPNPDMATVYTDRIFKRFKLL
jgi:hypothetical protein